MKTILLICIFLLNFLYAKNFVITNEYSNFANVATTHGKFEIKKPFLNIYLNKLIIRENEKYKHTDNIVGFKIGLATKTENNGWKVKRWSPNKKINITLKYGETHIIKNYKTSIPIDGLKDLSKYWLVIQIKNKHKKNFGYTYSHSSMSIFKNKKSIIHHNKNKNNPMYKLLSSTNKKSELKLKDLHIIGINSIKPFKNNQYIIKADNGTFALPKDKFNEAKKINFNFKLEL